MFGERIRSLRKEKGITQSELGEQLGIVKSTVSVYETEVYEPNIETLIKMADYFGVTTDYLLGRSDEKSDSIIHINRHFSGAERAIKRIQELIRISHSSQEKEEFCKSNMARPEDFYPYTFGYISGLIMAVLEEEEGDYAGNN